MKIIFHEKYYNSNYAMDPAAAIGRLEGIIALLKNNPNYEFITPLPASDIATATLAATVLVPTPPLAPTKLMILALGAPLRLARVRTARTRAATSAGEAGLEM